MTYKKILLSIALLLSALMMAARTSLDNTQLRLAYSRIYSMLEQYELSSSFAEESNGRELMKLFDSNPDARVYMDIMGSPDFGRMVSLESYISYIEDNGCVLFFEISDVRKGEPFTEKGKTILPVYFRKTPRYYDANDVFFSPESYYGAPIELTAFFVYENSGRKCYIKSIEGELDSKVKHLPDRFTVIRRNEPNTKAWEYDSLLVAYNECPGFDENGQSFCGKDVSTFGQWDPDVKLSYKNVPLKEQGRYDMVSFRYHPARVRARARLGFSPFIGYIVQGRERTRGRSWAVQASAELGYAIPAGNIKITPVAGIGYSVSGLGLYQKDLNYEFGYTGGAEELPLRTYQLSKVSTSYSFTDLFVPLYVDAEYRYDDIFMFHAFFGAKGYMNLNSRLISAYTVDGVIDGEPVHFIPDFFLNPNRFEHNKWDVSLVFGAEADYCLVKNSMYATAGLSYEHGLMPVFSSLDTKYFDSQQGIYPFEYSPETEDVANAPLYSGIRINRAAIWLFVGLFLKF